MTGLVPGCLRQRWDGMVSTSGSGGVCAALGFSWSRAPPHILWLLVAVTIRGRSKNSFSSIVTDREHDTTRHDTTRRYTKRRQGEEGDTRARIVGSVQPGDPIVGQSHGANGASSAEQTTTIQPALPHKLHHRTAAMLLCTPPLVLCPSHLSANLLPAQSAPTAPTSSPSPSPSTAPTASNAAPAPSSTQSPSPFTPGASTSAKSARTSSAAREPGTTRRRAGSSAPRRAATATRRRSSRCRFGVQTSR